MLVIEVAGVCGWSDNTGVGSWLAVHCLEEDRGGGPGLVPHPNFNKLCWRGQQSTGLVEWYIMLLSGLMRLVPIPRSAES